MAAKYTCPKCGRRFAEWGAEKAGFRCPLDEWCPPDHEEDIALVPVGSIEDKKSTKSGLKRSSRKAAAAKKPAVDAPGVPSSEDSPANDADSAGEVLEDIDSGSEAAPGFEDGDQEDLVQADGDGDDAEVEGEDAGDSSEKEEET